MLRQIVDGKGRIRICPAALRDLRMLLPRPASRTIVMRHAMKLQNWRKGDDRALDLEVTEVPQSVIRELCVGDRFGFSCGIRLAFFEDTLSGRDGRLWVIGLRRDDEPLSERMMDTFNHRREIIEENGEKD
jgi:hypothetical protein